MKLLLTIGLYVPSIMLAWYLGTCQAPEEEPEPLLPCEVVRVEPQVSRNEPRLLTRQWMQRRTAPKREAEQPPTSFVLSESGSFSESSRALMAFVDMKLQEGDHLGLLETLNREVMSNKQAVEKLLDPHKAAHETYPWLAFLMGRKDQIADLSETVFATMAEDPEAFAEYDQELLDIFTDILPVLLPGAIPPDRLDVFRAHTETILSAPRADLPPSVQSARYGLHRALDFWAPSVTPDEALTSLQNGGHSAAETLRLLGKINPDQFEEMDAARVLGPLIQSHNEEGLVLLNRAQFEASEKEALDQQLLDGFHQIPPSYVVSYLNATHRYDWLDRQPFFEAALARGEPWVSLSVRALAADPGAPYDYLRAIENDYRLSDEASRALAVRLGS